MCVLDKKEQKDMHMFSSLVAHLLAVAHLITKIFKKRKSILWRIYWWDAPQNSPILWRICRLDVPQNF
jgi:hypothetical protein